jgi:hypothetical protein
LDNQTELLVKVIVDDVGSVSPVIKKLFFDWNLNTLFTVKRLVFLLFFMTVFVLYPETATIKFTKRKTYTNSKMVDMKMRIICILGF